MKLKYSILIIFAFVLTHKTLGQKTEILNGKLKILVFFPDTIKTKFSPEDMIREQLPCFTYFIAKNYDLLDGESRRNYTQYFQQYDLESWREFKFDGGSLYVLNKKIDSVISRIEKFQTFKVKGKYLNYVCLEFEANYIKLDVGKTYGDPFLNILSDPSGVVIEKINSQFRRARMGNRLKSKLKSNIHNFSDFIKTAMANYTGVD